MLYTVLAAILLAILRTLSLWEQRSPLSSEHHISSAEGLLGQKCMIKIVEKPLWSVGESRLNLHWPSSAHHSGSYRTWAELLMDTECFCNHGMAATRVSTTHCLHHTSVDAAMACRFHASHYLLVLHRGWQAHKILVILPACVCRRTHSRSRPIRNVARRLWKGLNDENQKSNLQGAESHGMQFSRQKRFTCIIPGDRCPEERAMSYPCSGHGDWQEKQGIFWHCVRLGKGLCNE